MSPLRVEISEEAPDGTIVTTTIENLKTGFTVPSWLAALITGLPRTSLFRKEEQAGLKIRRAAVRNGPPGRMYTDQDLIHLAQLSPRAEVKEIGNGLVSVGVTTHPENTLVHSILRGRSRARRR